MGCHTWFARPVTQEEFKIFREHAMEHAWNLWGDTKENRECNDVRIDFFNKIKESVENNTDYWWKQGYGTEFDDKSEYTYVIKGEMYIDLGNPYNPIFPRLKRYHDIFRVKHYPTKVIHSRKELRRWMRKRYFDLEDWQLERISEFFRENTDGIITFG